MAVVMKQGSVRDREVQPPPVSDTARAVELLAELARGLPRSLMEVSSELLSAQKAGSLGLRSDPDQAYPSVEAAVGAVRFALAQATTAAQTLAGRLNDAALALTNIGDAPPR